MPIFSDKLWVEVFVCLCSCCTPSPKITSMISSSTYCKNLLDEMVMESKIEKKKKKRLKLPRIVWEFQELFKTYENCLTLQELSKNSENCLNFPRTVWDFRELFESPRTVWDLRELFESSENILKFPRTVWKVLSNNHPMKVRQICLKDSPGFFYMLVP